MNDMEKYKISKIEDLWICDDTSNGLSVIFEEKKFNETQEVKVPKGMDTDDALRSLVEMSDWLSIHHYRLVMPERVTQRQIIAHQISSIRRREGLTQQQLADRVCCSQQKIDRLEHSRHDAGIGFVADVAAALGCELKICEKDK